MYKIVLLQSLSMTKKIFTSDTIDSLNKFGEVIINKEEKNPDPERVKELIKDADVAITSWGCPKLDKDILEAAPGLKVVLHAAGTVKGIVSPEFWERGIRISSSAEAIGRGVAETALGLSIVSLKNLWQLSRNTRDGEWNKDKDRVKELYNINIGVVGAGRVGRHYIRLMKNFDVNILVYDPLLTEERSKELGVRKMELDELLKVCDLVSIHAPSIPETYKMINRERLMLMKDDAILINTARGSIIDEDALVAELKKGRLFACLDVTDPEPPEKEHPFRSLPNVILTPHIAGVVNNGMQRLGKYVVSELQRYIDGKRMDGEIEADMLNVIA